MSAAAQIPLEAYVQASRDALEEVVEKFAKIEQAADLQPGSLVEGLIEYVATATPDEVIGYIEDAYELTEVPIDWKDRVEMVVAQ